MLKKCCILIFILCVLVVGIELKSSSNGPEMKGTPKSMTISETSGNKSFVLKSKRRSVLIINRDYSLRTRPEKKQQEVTSLAYKEYDKDGRELNNFIMYNLKDVVKFFKLFLDTEICETDC